ncbi:hypothetical protein [Cellulomonas carbonis]|uniref:Uncharacterized protein n=1 Tax=Cellulomonas carbonis T26 TaxID=947969 RepID=A0A0A0BMW5_9CELL|nr:hypothetical protein [Cellulomonas carbonis]KGM09848.1 hypothetical protein N868_18355 [Cellulomonas carbonis T26]GGC13335.1 hypothetical protein GCM10010972_28310 [Cellulomonas carbonis]
MRGRRPSPRAAAALVVVGALAGAALVPGAAAAEELTFLGGIEVAPGLLTGRFATAEIGDDVVYVTSYERYESHGELDEPYEVLGEITSRPLERSEGSTVLGPRSLVGRTSAADVAEHEGTLAYVRASDDRLVLHRPDGTLHAPSWGGDPSFDVVGPQGMNDTWVASWDALFHRETGRRVDLHEALMEAPMPFGYEVYVTDVTLGTDHVAWSVLYFGEATGANAEYAYQVLAAPLVTDGIGAVRVIGRTSVGAFTVALEDELLTWVEGREAGDVYDGTVHVEDLAAGREVATHDVPGLVAPGVQTDLFVAGGDLVRGTVPPFFSGRPTEVHRSVLTTSDATPTTGYLPHETAVVAADGDLVAYVDTMSGVSLVDTAGGEVVIAEPPLPAGPVVTTTPTRLVRDGAVTPGDARCVQVTGEEAGVGVPDGATGAIVNVTAVRPNGVGYVVVYPDTTGTGATPVPRTSTVNFEPGRDVANSAFVALPENGTICYVTKGASRTGVIIDVSGWTVEGSGVVTREGVRVLDTRLATGPLAGGLPARTVRTVDVATAARLPRTAVAAIVNVTVTGTAAPGNLRVFPAGMAVPNTSTVNYAPGVDKANGTVVPLGEDGTIALYSDTSPSSRVHVVLDVVGYVEKGSPYVGVAPQRLLDTRAGSRVGDVAGPVARRTVVPLDVAGVTAVPDDATAVVLNVTAVAPSTNGNLRVYPDVAATRRTMPPDASVLNYVPGRAIPNLVVVAVPENGHVDLWSDQYAGDVQLVVDLVGYVGGS